MTQVRVVSAAAAALLLLGAAPACQQDTRGPNKDAITAFSDGACLKAAQAKDSAKLADCYTVEALLFPPNARVVTGRSAIQKYWAELVAQPGFAIDWKTARVEVAHSGDIAYSYGTYDLTLDDAQGQPATDRGKWLVAWRKQADGSWKMAVDIFNSDLPIAPAEEKTAAAKKSR